LIYWEKVRTTNFTTSKTKKNIEKVGDDHYIKKIYKRDQNVEKGKDQNIEITTSKIVNHYYKNHNVEKNEKNIDSLSFV
jgi:hypothetical protein